MIPGIINPFDSPEFLKGIDIFLFICSISAMDDKICGVILSFCIKIICSVVYNEVFISMSSYMPAIYLRRGMHIYMVYFR